MSSTSRSTFGIPWLTEECTQASQGLLDLVSSFSTSFWSINIALLTVRVFSQLALVRNCAAIEDNDLTNPSHRRERRERKSG